jgi:hypothetical protein
MIPPLLEADIVQSRNILLQGHVGVVVGTLYSFLKVYGLDLVVSFCASLIVMGGLH